VRLCPPPLCRTVKRPFEFLPPVFLNGLRRAFSGFFARYFRKFRRCLKSPSRRGWFVKFNAHSLLRLFTPKQLLIFPRIYHFLLLKQCVRRLNCILLFFCRFSIDNHQSSIANPTPYIPSKNSMFSPGASFTTAFFQ